MTADELRTHIKATPFRPFTIHVADGRAIPVSHHDFILVSPTGRIVDVFQPNDAHDILDIVLITGISFGPLPTQPTTSGNAP